MRETLKFTMKMKALSLFIQPHTISNLYDLLSSVDQTSYFEISLCFLSIQLKLLGSNVISDPNAFHCVDKTS